MKLKYQRIFLLIFASWWSLVLSEWLFLVTKKSFLSSLSTFQITAILFVSGFILVAFQLLLVSGATLIARYVAPRVAQPVDWFISATIALPISCLALLLIENFTYIVFDFNMAYATGVARAAYTLPFMIMFVFLTLKALRLIQKPGGSVHKGYFVFTATTLFVSILFAIPQIVHDDTSLAIQSLTKYKDIKRPNIVLFIADSVVADHTSLYGYTRKTTPNLEILAQQALVARNFFSNASSTTGAMGAFYTGKYPTRTHMIYRPDIFKGLDSYQHLPGILRNLGYRNIDASLRHYADPEDLNLKNGFHAANGRNLSFDDNGPTGLLSQHFPLESYFLHSVYKRLKRRFMHMFLVENMSNVYDSVQNIDRAWSELRLDSATDIKKLEYVQAEISRTQGPFFVHVHMLLTHGSMYWPKDRPWSYGQNQSEHFMTDFYDDAILGADHQMQKLIDFLKSEGRFDDTIFIYASDHGDRWVSDKRLPLVMRFPGNSIVRDISHNAQIIDLPPTILEYMGIKKPVWMDGESLLSYNDQQHRPIFLASISGVKSGDNETGAMVISDYSEPFFSLGEVSVVIANRVYSLNLASNILEFHELEGHTTPQSSNQFPSTEDVRKTLISHLHNNGYDVGSLTQH